MKNEMNHIDQIIFWNFDGHIMYNTISIQEWACHKMSKSDYLINTRIFERALRFVFDFIYAKIGLSLNKRVFHIFALAVWSCSVCFAVCFTMKIKENRWTENDEKSIHAYLACHFILHLQQNRGIFAYQNRCYYDFTYDPIPFQPIALMILLIYVPNKFSVNSWIDDKN